MIKRTIPLLLPALSWASPVPTPSPIPKIAEQVKEVYLRKAQGNAKDSSRDVITRARLEKISGSKDQSRYSFFALMEVRASLQHVYATMTRYSLYRELVPYVDRSDYSPETQTLHLEGGIWKFQLSSRLRFTEIKDRWLGFEVVEGHFKGLQGEVLFESSGEKGTLVFLRGNLEGDKWPPSFILERGAEIVFGFTGQRMRSYLESTKLGEKKKNGEQEVPQPQSGLFKSK